MLARYLDVTIEELDWFADLQHMNAIRAPSPKLAHYHHRWIAKARGLGGGVKSRIAHAIAMILALNCT